MTLRTLLSLNYALYVKTHCNWTWHAGRDCQI